MNERMLQSRILSVVGLAMIAIAAVAVAFAFAAAGIDGYDWLVVPSTLAMIFFPGIGSGLAARGAFLAKSRYRIFLYVALGLTLCGGIACLANLLNADNPNFQFPTWWLFAMFAYPIGAILSLVGAALVIIESFHRPPGPDDADGTL